MKALIKIGGTLLDSLETRKSIARQLAEAARACELVVVHGGGKQLTRFLDERGATSRFVGGLRVSDETVMDAVTKVIAGSVNKHLVSAIIEAGEAAVGLSGLDGGLTTVVPLSPDFGFVGKPDKTDGRLLDLLVHAGYVPVVACIAGDRAGTVFNVNADQMAVSCALGWGADELIFLTDVQGVKDGAGRVIPELTAGAIRTLVESGIAQGGMQAKLEAVQSALQGGLDEAVIASGHEPDVCRRLLAGELLGTRLVSMPAPATGVNA
jgi:acetylglutamate kinase